MVTDMVMTRGTGTAKVTTNGGPQPRPEGLTPLVATQNRRCARGWIAYDAPTYRYRARRCEMISVVTFFTAVMSPAKQQLPSLITARPTSTRCRGVGASQKANLHKL